MICNYKRHGPPVLSFATFRAPFDDGGLDLDAVTRSLPSQIDVLTLLAAAAALLAFSCTTFGKAVGPSSWRSFTGRTDHG